MGRCLARFAKDDAGATAIEYALIASMIALVIISAVTAIGTALDGKFVEVEAGFHNAEAD